MKQEIDNEGSLRSYLLGELGEQELVQFEERCFSNPQHYDQLLVVEDDLIDSYVRGGLSASERTHFENHFLRSPGRRERVEFAKSLALLVSQESTAGAPQRTPPAMFGFIPRSWAALIPLTAISLLVVTSIALMVETKHLRDEIQQAESERAALDTSRRELEKELGLERAHNDDLSAELEKERSRSNAGQGSGTQNAGILSFILTPSLVRGSGALKTLDIGPGAEWLSLQVSFKKGDYKSYRATLGTASGVEVRMVGGLKARASGSVNSVVLKLPAADFRNEDYILTLTGITDSGGAEIINEYPFRVRKR